MNNKQISEYKTLRATETKPLDELVNAAIQQGFQPFGSPYVQAQFSCQAMVKTETAEAVTDSN